MLDLKDKKECCGCSACAQRCPKQCIQMKEDEEGFLYPQIDTKNCIDCGLCEKTCPIIQSEKIITDFKEAYAAYSKDDQLRMKSSSGALFSLCAEKILKAGGVVFGAAFDSNMMVHHIFIERIEDLSLLQGSKYLQSRLEETFKETENFLKNGKQVLYTGTACQISGLKTFLKKEYENLFTIDVLCHGVPSPKVWKYYLKSKQKEYESNSDFVQFRNKSTGWKNFSMYLKFENQKEYKVVFREDCFMRLFLREICLRPSCHDCRFKDLKRSSDLTLGDCWGIDSKIPEMDDDKGTSVVLIHSDKGKILFDGCKEEICYQKDEVDVLLPPTADSRKSVLPHKNRKKFFKKLNQSLDIKVLVKLLEPTLFDKIVNKIKRVIKKIFRIK